MGRLPTRAGYTLLEILLALGVIAVLMGITVPYLADSFGKSAAEEMGDQLAAVVKMVRASALEQGEARRIAIQDNGLFPEIDSIPPVKLAKGWKLEVLRMTENRFRRPEKHEYWGFNSAGICEPLSLKIRSGRESLEMAFDPLTGAIVEE